MGACDVAEAEVGVDQRRVGLDVRAHHQDVARLSVGSSASRPSSTSRSMSIWRGSVAAVHLDGAVVWARSAAGRTRCGDVGLQPAEQGIGMFTAAEIFVGVRFGGEAALEFAKVAAEVASSGWLTLRWLVSSRRGWALFACEFLPQSSLGWGSQRCRSCGWPAHGGARPRWTAACVPEQRQPLRQVYR